VFKKYRIQSVELCLSNLFRYEGGGGLKTIVLERDIHTRINRKRNSAKSYVTPGGDEGQIVLCEVFPRNAFLPISNTKNSVYFVIGNV
jgi:hypothetical protein